MTHPRNQQRGKNATRTIQARERQAQVLELRKSGVPFDQIAAQLGYASHSGVLYAYHKALDRIAEEPAADLKKIEQERLNVLLGVALRELHTDHVMVSHGHVVCHELRDEESGDILKIPLVDHGVKFEAIDRVLRIMARRAALLGLDAPRQLEVLTPEAVSAEDEKLDSRIAELERIVRPELGAGPGPGGADPAPRALGEGQEPSGEVPESGEARG